MISESESDIDDNVMTFSRFDQSVNHLFKRNKRTIDELTPESWISNLPLKSDHASRPLYVNSDRTILLEAFSPLADHAMDFLIAVAEPVSRPPLMHEYRLTQHSLYAAVSVGLDAKSILDVLSQFSKTAIPDSIRSFVEKHTQTYGKVKLVLKDGSFHLEIAEPMISRILADDAIVQNARNSAVNEEEIGNLYMELFNPPKSTTTGMEDIDEVDDAALLSLFDMVDEAPTVPTNEDSELDEHENGRVKRPRSDNHSNQFNTSTNIIPTQPKRVTSFAIKLASVDSVRQRCSELGFPLIEEYDFRNDKTLPDLKIDLKPSTKLRPYQEKGLNKVFSNGRARSGIIVLPCGAGKTLVGVTAACTIKKSCLVLCTSSLSVDQWAREFRYWTTIGDKQIAKFTSQTKEKFTGEDGVLITTYTMLAFSGRRAYDAQKVMDFVSSKEWGFLLLDEVHVVPAQMFQKVLTIAKVHSKLGLTATLVREDDKIGNLNYLIGPKLFEANWLDLALKGHIARVQCAEVWCEMSVEFFREYLTQSNSRKRQLLQIMNPKKIQACQYLIDLHESWGDKIIVFSDNVFALKHYADKVGRPYIYGGTAPAERSRLLQQFRYNPALNTIFLSKVGDTSLDVPEASCLIQISSHYGSRRQEAQRLGRILRAKKQHSTNDFNAFFYTLVSTDTEEVVYSAKRKQFLVDQGYYFKIITKLNGLVDLPHLAYKTPSERLELLATVLVSDDTFDEGFVLQDQEFEDEDSGVVDSIFSSRRSGTLSSLSGADNMAYIEKKR